MSDAIQQATWLLALPFGVGLLVGHPVAATLCAWQRAADVDQTDSPKERRSRVWYRAGSVVLASVAGLECADLVGISPALGLWLGLAGGVSGAAIWPEFGHSVWPIILDAIRKRLGV